MLSAQCVSRRVSSRRGQLLTDGFFPLYVSQPASQFGATPQQTVWSPPASASKAGLVLTMSALAIVGLGIASFAGIGYFSYHAITKAIEKAENERKQREIYAPPPPTPYQLPTPYQIPTPSNLPKDKTISGGILYGKAIDLPKPAYPSAARAVRASGAVNVQVMVDENGNVISATAISGHPLLRQAA